MNLKLEKDSIRVRVSFAEAMILAREGRLQESFALPGAALVLSVLCDEEPLSFQARSGAFEMKVPRADLDLILSAANSGRVGAQALEIGAMNIHFEIDRFTVKKKWAIRWLI